MFDDQTAKIAGGTVGGLLVGLIGRLFLKLLSRDGVDRAKDRGEIDFVSRQSERIRQLEVDLAAMAKERNEAITRESIAVSQIGGFKAQVEFLTVQVQQLNVRVEGLMRDLQSYRDRGGGGEQWPRS